METKQNDVQNVQNVQNNESANTVKAEFLPLTDISAETIFPINSVVLLTQKGKSGLAITGVKDTKDITLVKHLLVALTAEDETTRAFNAEYADGNKDLTARQILRPYLSTKVIWKTDSFGRISKGVLSSVALKDTAFGTMFNASSVWSSMSRDDKRAKLHTYATAILARCEFFNKLNASLVELLKELAYSKDEIKVTRK